MAYRLSNDFDTRVRARTILARPNFIGNDAWSLSEPELSRAAETFMNSLAGNCAALRLHSRRLGQELLVNTRLGKALGYVPGRDSELEQLMECAEAMSPTGRGGLTARQNTSARGARKGNAKSEAMTIRLGASASPQFLAC